MTRSFPSSGVQANEGQEQRTAADTHPCPWLSAAYLTISRVQRASFTPRGTGCQTLDQSGPMSSFSGLPEEGGRCSSGRTEAQRARDRGAGEGQDGLEAALVHAVSTQCRPARHSWASSLCLCSHPSPLHHPHQRHQFNGSLTWELHPEAPRALVTGRMRVGSLAGTPRSAALLPSTSRPQLPALTGCVKGRLFISVCCCLVSWESPPHCIPAGLLRCVTCGCRHVSA